MADLPGYAGSPYWPYTRDWFGDDKTMCAEISPVRESPRDTPSSPWSHRIGGVALRRSLYYVIFSWFFGAFWMFSTTGATVTELAKYMGANDLTFGYLAAAGFLGSIFQIIGSVYTQSTGRVKRIILWCGTSQRALYIALALLPWVFPAFHGAMAIVVLVFLASALGNVGGPPWVLWMARLVPQRVRGKYFSRRSRVGIVVSALTAILVGVLLDATHDSWLDHWLGFISRQVHLPPLILVISGIFLVAAFAGMTEIQCYHRVEEIIAEPAGAGAMRSTFLAPLFDGPFMLYLLYSSVYTFAVTFSGTFIWVMVLDLLSVRSGHSWFFVHPYLAACAMIMLATNIGQIASYAVWGRLIDRLGCKPVIFVASSMQTLTWLAFIFMSRDTLALGFLGCFFGGVFASALEIANFNMILAFTHKGGSGYQAMAAVFINIAGLLAGLCAGFFAYWMGRNAIHVHLFGHIFSRYNVLFLMAAGIKCIGDYVILPWVQDSPAKPIRFAIRYIMGNAFEMLNSQFFAPLRSAVINEGFRPWRRFK